MQAHPVYKCAVSMQPSCYRLWLCGLLRKVFMKLVAYKKGNGEIKMIEETSLQSVNLIKQSLNYLKNCKTNASALIR